MAAERLAKGLVPASLDSIYEVPEDFYITVKSIIFCNVASTAKDIRLDFDDTTVIKRELEVGETYRLTSFDQILLPLEEISAEAESIDAVSYYISGKLIPVGYETERQFILGEWEEWFDSVQEGTYIIEEDLNTHLEDNPHGNESHTEEFKSINLWGGLL